MAYKSIDQQLHEMEEELKLAKDDYKKMERHRDKLLTRDRNKEQKERTRRLIQKGAILESIDPNLAQLEGKFLKKFLVTVFRKERPEEYAKIVLREQTEETDV